MFLTYHLPTERNLASNPYKRTSNLCETPYCGMTGHIRNTLTARKLVATRNLSWAKEIYLNSRKRNQQITVQCHPTLMTLQLTSLPPHLRQLMKKHLPKPRDYKKKHMNYQEKPIRSHQPARPPLLIFYSQHGSLARI